MHPCVLHNPALDLQAYILHDAFEGTCDATKIRGTVAVVFVAKAEDADGKDTSESTDATLAAEQDPLSFGRHYASRLSMHVYAHDIASRMVATGANRFHGGPCVVGWVPTVRLDLPENMLLLQATLCKVGGMGCCCWCPLLFYSSYGQPTVVIQA